MKRGYFDLALMFLRTLCPQLESSGSDGSAQEKKEKKGGKIIVGVLINGQQIC